MIVYHMSETLELGDRLQPDFQRTEVFCRPFIQALERGENCFAAMVLNGKYLFAVLDRSGLREWADYAKWATEAAFEFVRARDFPGRVSRLRCCYYYDSLENAKKLFNYEWGWAGDEERAHVRLFEIALEDRRPDRFDMCLYDMAYDAMAERQDCSFALDCARRYYAGEHGAEPVWELLSAGPAQAVRDITSELRGGDRLTPT
ncbi:MAG: hypothetical protein IK095_00770 [Oscillospiraceae bacterium]|nr:hypothetical protein [Oscillospiraceae bacterium]